MKPKEEKVFWYKWVQDELTFGRLVELKATGWSMFPSIWPGAKLTLSMVPFDSLKTSDLIAFIHDNKAVMHRIIAIQEVQDGLFVQTQGDSMEHPDEPIAATAYLGKIILINGSNNHRAFKSVLELQRLRNMRLKRIILKLIWFKDLIKHLKLKNLPKPSQPSR